MKTLRHCYSRGVDARATLAALEQILDQNATRVAEVGIATIRFLAERLGIRTPILISSELGLEQLYRERFPDQACPTHRIIAYMEALGTTELLEGESGQSYFDVDLFRSHQFDVRRSPRRWRSARLGPWRAPCQSPPRRRSAPRGKAWRPEGERASALAPPSPAAPRL
jgi:hypothetical protein